MLSKQIVEYLNFFDSFGYNSGFSSFARHPKLIFFLYIFQILLAIILILFQFDTMLEYYASLGIMARISEFLEYFAPLYTHWFIIFDSIYHRRSHQLFWSIFQKITSSSSNYKFSGCVVIFVEFFLVKALALLVRCVYKHVMVAIAYDLLFKFCQIRMFYYIFCLEILHFCLDDIHTEIISVKVRSLSMKSLKNRLKSIRERFHNVYKMFGLLNEMFGWSHVSLISCCVYMVLTQSSWIYLYYSSYSSIRRISKYPVKSKIHHTID